jgi:hypothetical protein
MGYYYLIQHKDRVMFGTMQNKVPCFFKTLSRVFAWQALICLFSYNYECLSQNNFQHRFYEWLKNRIKEAVKGFSVILPYEPLFVIYQFV